MVAVDHKTNDIYLVALYMPSKASSVQAADAWIEGTVAHLFSSRPQRSSKSDAAELEDQNFQRARDIKASTSSHIGLSQERGTKATYLPDHPPHPAVFCHTATLPMPSLAVTLHKWQKCCWPAHYVS